MTIHIKDPTTKANGALLRKGWLDYETGKYPTFFVERAEQLYEEFHCRVCEELVAAFPNDGEEAQYEAAGDELFLCLFAATINSFDGLKGTLSVQDAIDSIVPAVDEHRAATIKYWENINPDFAKELAARHEKHGYNLKAGDR